MIFGVAWNCVAADYPAVVTQPILLCRTMLNSRLAAPPPPKHTHQQQDH